MQKIVSYTYIKGNIVLNVPHEKGEKLLFASIFHFLFNHSIDCNLEENPCDDSVVGITQLKHQKHVTQKFIKFLIFEKD